MGRKASAMRWWVVATMVIAAATAQNAGAAPLAERVGPTVAALRTGAGTLDKAGLPGYARKQRDLAETIQLSAAAHDVLTTGHLNELQALGKSLTAGASMYERTDPRKAEALTRQATTVQRAVAALRPLVGTTTAGGGVTVALLTVQVKASAGDALAELILVEPARTFTGPDEITAYLNSSAEHFSEATIVFEVDDAVTFATLREVVHAVADASLNGPMRIDGLELHTPAPTRPLGRTPTGPLPDDLRPDRSP
ncbi:MAG: hypothetical protein ACOC95_01360 [Planctomycetota bacterium]